MSEPETNNPLGNASLGLGLVSSIASFGIALAVLQNGADTGFSLTGTPLWVGGLTGALLGLTAAGLGLIAMFGKDRSKLAAAGGLVLGLLGAWIFFLAATAAGS